MKGFVLIHIGSELPSYFYICVDQIRKYYDGPIYTVFNIELAKVEDQQRYNTSIIPINDILKSRCVRNFENFDFVKEYGDFWSLAFKRLFVLEEVMRKFDLTEIIHIENDILIYEDPNKLNLASLLQNFMYITPVGPKYATYAYCYIPDVKTLEFVNQNSLRILKSGKSNLLDKYKEGMVNEMLIAKELVDNAVLSTLPVLPYGEASQNLDVVGKLFDGASVGQYVGGTPGNSTPFMGDHHYVGAELIAKNVNIEWQTNEYKKNLRIVGGKVKNADVVEYKEPYMRDSRTGILYKLCNLHIHSKDLKRWV